MVRVLLISGSLRRGSSNSALLSTAAALAPEGVSASLYQGLQELPHFNPDEDAEGVEIAAPVARMRSQVGESDAILFCTPEYAGTLPGAFKNLLEWNVGSTEIYGLPVASVNVAGPGRGENAEASLRTVLAYIGAELVEEASVRIPVTHDSIGSDGLLSDPEARRQVIGVLEALAARVRDSEDHQ